MTPEIRTLAGDELITEPGFYNITLERHHNQPCDGASVTSGVLRKMEMHSPADVWAFHRLNPNKWPEPEPSAALRMGAAMAYFVEGGPECVLEHFDVHPKDKPRKPTEAQIEKYDAGEGTDAGIKSVEYWRAVEAAPTRYLDQSEFELICTMGAVLEQSDDAMAVMEGIPECTMAYQDERTGIWMLARPDTVSFSGITTDYKKMSSKGRPFDTRAVDNAITKFGYDMQGGFACEVFERLTQEWPAFGIIAQSDKAPHHVILRDISEEDLRFGQFRNRRALDRFHDCFTSGHWPGPGETVGAYQRPDWQYKQLVEQMATAGTAP